MKFPFKKIKLFSGFKLGQKKKFGIYPERDWRMLILGFLFVNLILIGYLTVIYYSKNVKNDYVLGGKNNASEITSIDKKLLEEILNIYEERKTYSETLPQSPGVPDLSI